MELFEKFDPITADFTFIRWLGDRKGIEERTKMWDTVIMDRTAELNEWVEIARKVHKRRIQIFAYANNHYAGHAPATVEQFQAMLGNLDEIGATSAAKLKRVPSEKRQNTLFDS